MQTDLFKYWYLSIEKAYNGYLGNYVKGIGEETKPCNYIEVIKNMHNRVVTICKLYEDAFLTTIGW